MDFQFGIVDRCLHSCAVKDVMLALDAFLTLAPNSVTEPWS